jgi:hypothetical protein
MPLGRLHHWSLCQPLRPSGRPGWLRFGLVGALPALLLLSGLLAACDRFGDDDPSEAAASRETSSTTATPATAPTVPAPTVPADPDQWCEGLEARSGGAVASDELTEVSGLAASAEHPGVLWAHNDSGHEPALYALSADGADRGRFPLPGVEAVDIEDMALAGGMVYLADIGDNDLERTEVALYRFPEPDPAASGPVEEVEVLRFRYPDGAHDAESLLVDPLSGEVAIVDKAIQLGFGDGTPLGPAPATVFTASPPFAGGEVLELVAAGTVALDKLDLEAASEAATGPAADLGLDGLATGADIRADGRVIALRTYATVWLFDRPAGSSLVEALAGTPCEAPTRPESQGEAVALLPGPGTELVTISEGPNPEVNLISAP